MDEVLDRSEWVTALEAVKHLSIAFKGDEAAKSTILSRLADGLLEGQADKVVQEADTLPLDIEELIWGRCPLRHPAILDRCYFRAASKKNPEAGAVPASFMAIAEGWKIENSMVSWAEGLFVATRQAAAKRSSQNDSLQATDIRIRRVCLELRFRLDDIEAISRLPTPDLLRDDLLSGSIPPRKANKGGKPRDPRWNNWIAELAFAIFDGDFTPPSTATNLYNIINDRLAAQDLEGPDFETVRRTLAAINTRFGKTIK